jgi:TolB-like protein
MVEGGGEEKASGGTPAVFISYASQDAATATRICSALRQAGIEVWFDQSELRGGDVWDQRIRREIRDCTLFMPVISVNTASRHEGYFRLEWDLADQRTHMMARDRAFIVPVCLDATKEAGTDVPESFHRVQWTRLPGGETRPEFTARIARLLSPQPQPTDAVRQTAGPAPVVMRRPLASDRSVHLRRAVQVTVAALVAAALAWLLINKPWSRGQGSAAPPATTGRVTSTRPSATPAAPASAAFSPPPHSVAVLPFVNMSGDPQQEYFSDGISEELINALSHIASLRVIARTSSFSFKGQQVDIDTIAHKLNVAAVLEGSIRRDQNKVRITVQLINTLNGFHIWSEDYDRDLKNILNLQTDIAAAVARQLQAKLLGDETSQSGLGGARNPEALDAYLRGKQISLYTMDKAVDMSAVSAFNKAIELDPNFAMAYAKKAVALSAAAGDAYDVGTRRHLEAEGQQAAERALQLAPDLAAAHAALGSVRLDLLDYAGAASEAHRAAALAPGDARILSFLAAIEGFLDHPEAAVSAARRVVQLDPLNPASRTTLAARLYFARQFAEALTVAQEAKAMNLDTTQLEIAVAASYLAVKEASKTLAMFTAAVPPTNERWQHFFLTMAYQALGKRAEADNELAKFMAIAGNSAAYNYAEIYAQRAEIEQGLHWLKKAEELHDPALPIMRSDWMVDPLRERPEFKAIEGKLYGPPASGY